MRKKTIIFLFIIVTTITIKFFLSPEIYASTTYNYKIDDNFDDNSLLVMMNENVSLEKDEFTIHDFPEIDCKKIIIINKSIKKKYLNNFKSILYIELETNSKGNVLDCIEILEKRKDICYVSPNYMLYTSDTYPNNYDSDNYTIESINLHKAWDITTGSSNVKVGILDTGIDGDHVELINRINVGLCRDFSMVENYDEFVNYEPNSIYEIVDNNGHGTHVAGIIGAQGNNSVGVIGVNWNIELVSLKVADDNGNSNVFAISSAIFYAEENDIDILNLSINLYSDYQISGGILQPDPILYNAISSYTGLIVCSAGNDNVNIDLESNYTYPSAYDLDNLITVGAINSINELAIFSNYGSKSVDIYAPGDAIYSTIPNGYGYKNGTSMSAPFVTGVAALIKSINFNLTASEIKQLIIQNYELIDITLPNNTQQRVKKLDAYKVLSAVHSHAYLCSYFNNLTHKFECICGDYYYGNHVVSSQSATLLRAKCLECGTWLDLREDIGSGQLSIGIVKSTENGSYILGNGIIVLNPRDYDSYYNGTLIFHSVNNLIL